MAETLKKLHADIIPAHVHVRRRKVERNAIAFYIRRSVYTCKWSDLLEHEKIEKGRELKQHVEDVSEHSFCHVAT